MIQQVSTFILNGNRYGLPAADVQEIAPQVEITPVPLAPAHILGLINLRGQFATVVSLSRLFGLEAGAAQMNVVCRADESIVAFSVDEVGDVIEIDPRGLSAPPGSVHRRVVGFVESVYRADDCVYAILSLPRILSFLASNNQFKAKAA